MTSSFFEKPILNFPCEYPGRHWKLDASGQPHGKIIDDRRSVSFISPTPKPKKRRGKEREELVFAGAEGVSTAHQQYDSASTMSEIWQQVDQWWALPNPSQWPVSPETARLLERWPHHLLSSIRSFCCQTKAVETAIGLSERPDSRAVAVRRRLGIAKESVYRWIDAGGLPPDRIGRLWRFRLSEVDAWVEAGGADHRGHQKEEAP